MISVENVPEEASIEITTYPDGMEIIKINVVTVPSAKDSPKTSSKDSASG